MTAKTKKQKTKTRSSPRAGTRYASSSSAGSRSAPSGPTGPSRWPGTQRGRFGEPGWAYKPAPGTQPPQRATGRASLSRLTVPLRCRDEPPRLFEKRDQVGKALHTKGLFKSFGHQGSPRGAQCFDFGSEHGLLDPLGPARFEARCRLLCQETREGLASLRHNQVC